MCLSTISGMYLTIIMAMSALSVVFSVFVLNIHHKNSGCKPPPRWLKAITRIAAFFTCSRAKFSDVKTTWTPVQTYSDQVTPQSNFSTAPSGQYEEVESGRRLLLGNASEGVPCNAKPSGVGFMMDEPQIDHEHSSGNVEKAVLGYVNKLLSGHDRQTAESKCSQDWREIARVLDRLFFMIFILVTVISSIVVLMVLPLTKDISIDKFIASQ